MVVGLAGALSVGVSGTEREKVAAYLEEHVDSRRCESGPFNERYSKTLAGRLREDTELVRVVFLIHEFDELVFVFEEELSC